ncbi:hypothetical protein Goarm_016090, partial [Gossypium armourianum]|nr:hypothetical protein [Gossypium armourianum]
MAIMLKKGQSYKVAVVGCGTAGSFKEKVESDLLGLDPNREIVHSSLYRSLRTIMGFTDYPFVKKEGGDPRSFPGHEEVLRFLEDFARDFGLMELIRFGHEVIRVERVDETNHKWIVEFRTRETEPRWEEVFEAVVICNVVLIGDSASAHDILKQIASVAKQVHQAIRGPSFQLKRLENHDNVLQQSMIECTHKDGKVLFQNGSIVNADVILRCT